MKYIFSLLLICIPMLLQAQGGRTTVKKEKVAPGVYKLTVGVPDEFTPSSLFGIKPSNVAEQTAANETLPFKLEDIIITANDRGCNVAIPLGDGEQLYGFGLQMGSFEQRGLRRRPLVNDNPLNNLGYTHAPQPFYVSTAGYGIIVNTSRYTTFYCGSNSPKKPDNTKKNERDVVIRDNPDDLYRNIGEGNYVFADIPNSEGIEIFVIEGGDMKDVVSTYNQLSGGGCLPPMWGLGLKYRVKGDFNDQQVLQMANYFRNNNIPCDVFGLEPGWQTWAYSCTYVWSDKFPNPRGMISKLKDQGLKVNLWEHAYVNPASPIYNDLYNYSGDFLVWNGLVPDFTLPEARKIYGGYHDKLLDDGVMGFKLDECDNSNLAYGSATWGFPDMTMFPSGIDGEQMHQVFGSLYVNTIDSLYRNRNLRTYQDYRSSGLFMSSVPAVLYSDTYDLKEYIQMICNSAFGGLLWAPELRESNSEEELFHRLRVALLAPQAVINAWYLSSPPWMQYDKGLNNDSIFLANADETSELARTLINTRMSLIPYLYSAFFDYHKHGTPPFRPLIMDYPEDELTRKIDDQFMIGDNIMAAPLYRKGSKRKVYFPAGTWYDFNTKQKYEGGKEYELETPYSQFPLYVKAGTILPVAEPVQNVADDTVFKITCQVYGKDAQPAMLIEDDGVTYNYETGKYNTIKLYLSGKKGKTDRKGDYKGKRYQIVSWNFID